MLPPESLPQQCLSRAISPERCKEKCTSFDKGYISLLHRTSSQAVSSLRIPHSSPFNLWGQATWTVCEDSHPTGMWGQATPTVWGQPLQQCETSHPKSVRTATPTVCEGKPPQKCENEPPQQCVLCLCPALVTDAKPSGYVYGPFEDVSSFFVQFSSVHLRFVAYLWNRPFHFIDYFLCLVGLQYSAVFAFVTEFWESYSQITTRTEAKKLSMPAVSLCRPGLARAITM